MFIIKLTATKSILAEKIKKIIKKFIHINSIKLTLMKDSKLVAHAQHYIQWDISSLHRNVQIFAYFLSARVER